MSSGKRYPDPPVRRRREAILLALLLPVWALLLQQSYDTTWSFTRHPYPVERVARYEPLRTGLREAAGADLFAGYEARKDQTRVFWHAQFALTPTVLTQRYDRATVLRRARRADPYLLVVEFPTHAEFTLFVTRYERVASRSGRTVRVQDLGNGIGLLESRSEG